MIIKSKIYKLRKHMAVVTSPWQQDNSNVEYTLTIEKDFFTVLVEQINSELISFKFYRGGNTSQEPLEYGARLEFDENDNDYWRCYTSIPAFMPDQINSGGSYDPLEAVLLAFEQDVYG